MAEQVTSGCDPESADMFEILRRFFGFAELRQGQEQVIRCLLAGRPALAVFPTGGGKSLCYQLPALMLEGLTLVVSPLIALMKDQVDALRARGVPAARLDSTLGADELGELYRDLDHGTIKLLYIAPERLANEAFRKRIGLLRVAMVAIDEAHCISEWGHNFRPDYLKVAGFCRKLKVARVLALTATATPKVARDIRRQFRIAAADHVCLSFHRPNLDLRVTPCRAEERKTILLERLRALAGPAVVYVTRQETAEEVATFLKGEGVAARAYHAGLPDEFRSDAQRSFMTGETRVVVATIAFGMGIDKADIRGVIHYNLPKSLENHTQEIGRAGRDGGAAVCEMLVCGNDLTVLENFIYSDTPTEGALSNLLDRILRRSGDFDISLYDLSVSCDIRVAVVSTVLAYLEADKQIEARGIFHSNYRLKMVRPVGSILAGLPRPDRRFLELLFEQGSPGRSWVSFEPTSVAEALGVKREKVVAALCGLEAAGDAALEVSGVRHAYRRRAETGDLRELVRRYVELFKLREKADLERLEQVVRISAHRGCFTGYLTRHFGEILKEPCGHCDRCRGVPAKVVKRPPSRRILDAEWKIIREVADQEHAALGNARQLARFLCGMSSPAATRARLGRHDAFGLLADCPFPEVLTITTSLRGGVNGPV